MKILQIIPGKIWGGAEQYIVDLGRELEARGHEVTYLAYAREAVTAQLERRAIPYQTLPSDGRSTAPASTNWPQCCAPRIMM